MKRMTSKQVRELNNKCYNNFKLDREETYLNDSKTLSKIVNLNENYCVFIKIEHMKTNDNKINVRSKFSYCKIENEENNIRVLRVIKDLKIIENLLPKSTNKKFEKSLIEVTEMIDDEFIENVLIECNLCDKQDIMSLTSLV